MSTQTATVFATANRETVTRAVIQCMMSFPNCDKPIGLNKNGSVDFIDENGVDDSLLIRPQYFATADSLANPVFWEENYISIFTLISGLLALREITFDYTESFDGLDECEIRKIERYNRYRNVFKFHTGSVSANGFVFDSNKGLEVQVADWLKNCPSRTATYITDKNEIQFEHKYKRCILTVRLMVNGKTVRILKETSSVATLFSNFSRELNWFVDDSSYYSYMSAFYSEAK